MGLSFQTEGAGDDVAPGARARRSAGLWMGGGDVRHGFGAAGKQGGADVVDTGVALEEPARHLRLSCEAFLTNFCDFVSMIAKSVEQVDGCVTGNVLC